MNQGLPIVFAVYPLLLSGIAIIWLYRYRGNSRLNWLLLVLSNGSISVFAFLTGPWAFSSYYLRYLVLGLYIVVIIISYLGMQRRVYDVQSRDSKVRILPISVFLLFMVLDVQAVVSRIPHGERLDVSFPLRAGTYYVLQGGGSAITNPFHAMSGSHLAIDIAKLNTFGNRANGIAPRLLNAYEIFGEKVYSPCKGSIVKVRDSLPDNAPGHPDLSHPEGNYVIVKCAGVDIFMAHLKRGSIKVLRGERVGAGQLLAEIGNSGNSLEPHLHIHASKEDVEIWLLFNGRSLSINSVLDIPG